MEIVKILGAVGATARNGKTYYKISFEDGRKGSSFNAKFLDLVGKEAKVNIEKNGQYLNIDLAEEKTAPALSGENTGSPLSIKLELAKAMLNNPAISKDDYVLIGSQLYAWITT